VRKRRGNRVELMVWGLAGAALDAVAFIGLWMLLDSIGPLNRVAEAYLGALALVAVPWLVHVVALPALFQMKTWIGVARLATTTIVFIAFGGIVIPALGYILFLFVAPIVILATRGSLRMPLGPQTLADQISGYIGLLVIASVVGAAVGRLLHELHLGDSDARAPRPKLRSDVLGGAIAAFLAFGGMPVASSLGLFSRQVLNDPLGQLSIPPQLPATVVIGVLALLPHLLMVGRDLCATPDLENESPPASSVPRALS
jgi:hypothetical protein